MKGKGKERLQPPGQGSGVREHLCQGHRIRVVFEKEGSLEQRLEELAERGWEFVPYGGILPAVPGGWGKPDQRER